MSAPPFTSQTSIAQIASRVSINFDLETQEQATAMYHWLISMQLDTGRAT